MHLEVGDGGDGQVELERRPLQSTVPRHVEPRFRTGEEQIATHVVLAHHARERTCRNPPVNLRPGCPVVGGFIQPRRMVVELVARSGDVRGALVERRDFDGVDEALGQPLGRDVLPRLPAVARELHQAIVAPRVDHALLMRGLGDVRERAIVLGAHRLVGVGLTGLPLLLFLVTCEVGGDSGPRAPEVRCFQQQLRAVIKGVRLVAAPDDWCVPVVAVLHVLCVAPEVLDGRRHDVGACLRLRIQHVDGALIAAAQHVARVVRIEREEGAFTAGRGPPAVGGNPAAAEFTAGNHDGRVVLLRGVNAIGEPVVRIEAVELRRGLIALCTKALAAVEGDDRSAIVGNNEVVRVTRVDPQIMVVPVHTVYFGPGAAAVVGAERRRTEHV